MKATVAAASGPRCRPASMDLLGRYVPDPRAKVEILDMLRHFRPWTKGVEAWTGAGL